MRHRTDECRQLEKMARGHTSSGSSAQITAGTLLKEMTDREEFVLFDADGPGAVTRWWMTFAGAGGSGYLRVYIDNAEEPLLAATPFQIISGDRVSVEPLASSVSKLTVPAQRGHTLFYPIPYSKHCKITYCSHNIKADGDDA